MSSLAQEESRSISENVRWGQRKKAADGKYSLNYKHFLGYDKGEDGQLVINEEQAKIVRRIFGEFLAGNSAFQIAKNLTEDGIPTPAGQKKRKTRKISEFIKALEASGEEFSETDWCVMVEKVTVFKEKMVFLLTSGAEVEV